MNNYPKLKPLVVRFNHGFLRDTLRENSTKTFRKLGVDVHEFTPNWNVVKRLMLQAFLEKGDFIRWQNASIGYNVPLSGDGVLDNLRLSLTGQNLLLFTDYSGVDPEVSAATGDLGSGVPTSGIDYNSFPRPRTITFGINARF